MSTELARVEHRQPGGLAVIDEATQRSLEFQARTIAALDKRLRDRQGRVDQEAAVGLAITLYNYGLPVTVTNAKKLHLINGEPVESAQLLIGLLNRGGMRIRVVEESGERAVVRGWRPGDPEPHEVTYTVDQARESGALDEWVEWWEKGGDGWKLKDRLTIAVDGQDLAPPNELPEWARRQIAAGKVKRNDAWHKYRSDMLINRAVRRLAKRMGGDALLGVGWDDPAPAAAANADPETGEIIDAAWRHDEHDDDPAIADAEIVHENPTEGAAADGGGSEGLSSDPEPWQQEAGATSPEGGHPSPEAAPATRRGSARGSSGATAAPRATPTGGQEPPLYKPGEEPFD